MSHQYAWRIRDTIEDRDWLSLSADEAELWEDTHGGEVSIVRFAGRPAVRLDPEKVEAAMQRIKDRMSEDDWTPLDSLDDPD